MTCWAGQKAEALKSAKRASAVVHGELKRGLNSLATIASTAPWIGLFGTVLRIYTSFGGVTGSKTSIMAYYFDALSRAFVPSAIGLVVALVAIWWIKIPAHRGWKWKMHRCNW
jgi:biopolymer transport protein ExbB/biopolymer transport protein TolQ